MCAQRFSNMTRRAFHGCRRCCRCSSCVVSAVATAPLETSTAIELLSALQLRIAAACFSFCFSFEVKTDESKGWGAQDFFIWTKQSQSRISVQFQFTSLLLGAISDVASILLYLYGFYNLQRVFCQLLN